MSLPVYIFLDEGGNFDFSASGSRFFTMTAVTMLRPFGVNPLLDAYKYDLIEHPIKPRVKLEHFHCADDNSHVRKRVFDILAKELRDGSVDSVIVEKSKTDPAIRVAEKFYPAILGQLMHYAVEGCSAGMTELIIITDTIPVAGKKKAIEKAIKQVLAKSLDANVPYRIMHHASKAHYGMQVADYLNWAIFWKWEAGDPSYLVPIMPKIRSAFETNRTEAHRFS